MLKQNLSVMQVIPQFARMEIHFNYNWNSNKDLCCSFLGK